MRALAALAALALVLPAAAADCVWQAEDGGQIQQVSLNDYNYAFQPAGKYGTLCVVLRSPEQTTLACDDGAELELAYAQTSDGQTAVVLADKVYSPVCQ